jgi:hypothetical protein
MPSFATLRSIGLPALAAWLLAGAFSSPLYGHVVLLDPPARSSNDALTEEPCGGLIAGEPGAAYAAGSEIEVTINLAVKHTQSLVVFVSFDDFSTRSELARMRVPSPGVYTMTVPLPIQPLGPAVLQLTHGKYVSCADITLTEPPPFEMNPGMNGNWWGGPERNGEGAQVEVADGGDGSEVLVATVYSYDSNGSQVFLVAVGPVEGDQAEVEVFITEGGSWGEGFDPEKVNMPAWGTGRFTAVNCRTLLLSLTPNEQFQNLGYTQLSVDLVRLTSSLIPCPLDKPE